MGLNLNELHQAVHSHTRVVRILIVEHKGSTPRETGTSMLAWDGGQSGTIGGGALELQAMEFAQKITAPAALTFALGPGLGQCCGGSTTVVFEPFIRENLPPLEHPYLRLISGDCTQPLALRRKLKSHRNSSAHPEQLLWHKGWLFEPPQSHSKPIWLFGAGHVGRAIVETLGDLPFDLTWVDTSAGRFPAQIPSNVTRLVAANPVDVVKYAPDTAHHMVLTYSHELDFELCHAILGRPHTALGLIGSKTKRARFTKRLAARGHRAETVAKMICPIGQRNLGKTPKAIAIGVASELLTMNVQKTGRIEVSA